VDSSADSSATIRIGKHSFDSHIVKNEPSKGKTRGFAIVIILGLGGLAVAGVGLGGYLQAGSLSSLGQVNSIIMMAAGGGGGIVFLIIGIVGSVKNRQTSSHQQNDLNEGVERNSIVNPRNTTASSKLEKKNIGIASTIETPGGLIYETDAWKVWDIYGADAWGRWNVKVLDVVPEAPQVNLSKRDKILLYIPQRISVNGKEKDFTLAALKEISGGSFCYFSNSVEQQFGDSTAAGWVLIDKTVFPESRAQNYATQKKMVEDEGCRLPSVLEAIVLNLMVFAFTGERLYGQDPWTYTRCAEKVDGKYPVVVGGFGSAGLVVNDDGDSDSYGAACALREF
jgi:hypothetical protein